MTQTQIEWADRVWNPVTGCTKVSAGCKHCYAETLAHRFWKDRAFTDVQTHEDRLSAPLRWRKPSRVFVNSMSDLFHEDVPDAVIDQVFAVMALADWHTFIVLTKRPKRMRDYMADAEGQQVRLGRRLTAAIDSVTKDRDVPSRFIGRTRSALWSEHIDMVADDSWRREGNFGPNWPHIQLGVSVETQETADERIPLLLQTPAAKHIVSYEPALGPVTFIMGGEVTEVGHINWLTGCDESDHPIPGLDQIIVGGESGPKARPCDVAWIRSTVQQCRTAGVACFVKQLGANPFEHDADGEPHVLRLSDKKGADMAEWPADLRVREVV